MQPKALSKYTWFIILGIVIFLMIILFFDFYLLGHLSKKLFLKSGLKTSVIDNQKNTYFKNISLVNKMSAGIPVLLKIPDIDVNAKIYSVGITSNGAVGTPEGPADVAWYDLGPRPGENGSAVIVGHYGQWKNGEESVFNNLNKLNPGDKVYVLDDKGVTNTFIVRALQTYGQNEYAPEVFSFRDGKAYLNLITCDGVWDNIHKTYSNRLVIFTDKE